jgi:tetratricopeptide (TPR) repeat protein
MVAPPVGLSRERVRRFVPVLFGGGTMRYFICLAFGCAVGVLVAAPLAHAGPVEDCSSQELLVSDQDRVIQACSQLIQQNPRDAVTYNNRGNAYSQKGDYDRAIADYNEAIRISPRYAKALSNRGSTYKRKFDYDSAIRDLNQAIEVNPRDASAFAMRGDAYEAKGDYANAIEDYQRMLSLPATQQVQRDWQAFARKRLAALQNRPPEKVAPPPVAVAPQPPAPVPTAKPPVAAPAAGISLGRRVALVIGNANYRTVLKLANPRNDAGALAVALRAAGFTEVVERYDLGAQQMRDALKTFEEKATGADWAVVYYAGHGIEVDGRNYLIPVDAALKSASDVEDETLPLDRVLARVAVAKTLQLVILDACRDNPFATRMAQAGSVKRSIGTRGLARVEPEHPNLFIAYSARHGEAALDGADTNSPYAKAIVKHLAVPGLALNTFFIRVRAEVLAQTSGRQRPFEYGSLTDENLFFRPAAK